MRIKLCLISLIFDCFFLISDVKMAAEGRKGGHSDRGPPHASTPGSQFDRDRDADRG